MAWNSALLYDMIYTQPVVYEFNELKMPVLLMIGTKEQHRHQEKISPRLRSAKRSAIMRCWERRRRSASARYAGGINDMGHAPQMQDPEPFHEALLKGLQAR